MQTMSQQTNIGEGEKKKIGQQIISWQIDEFIPSSSKKPKSFIWEIGMDNLDVETIERIQDHEQQPINDSEDEIVSILIQNRKVQQISYTKVWQIPTSHPKLNQRTGNHLPVNLTPKSAPVQRDCSRIVPILNELPMDSLNQPPQTKRGKNI